MSATASFPQQTAEAERHVIPLSAVFVPQGENPTPRVWALNKDGTVSSVAVVLGCGYGCCLVAGLLQTQRVAPRGELAGLTAVYYALTYVGFAAPVVLAQLTRVTSYPVLLLALAALALLTLLVAGRRSPG